MTMCDSNRRNSCWRYWKFDFQRSNSRFKDEDYAKSTNGSGVVTFFEVVLRTLHLDELQVLSFWQEQELRRSSNGLVSSGRPRKHCKIWKFLRCSGPARASSCHDTRVRTAKRVGTVPPTATGPARPKWDSSDTQNGLGKLRVQTPRSRWRQFDDERARSRSLQHLDWKRRQ